MKHNFKKKMIECLIINNWKNEINILCADYRSSVYEVVQLS